MTAARDGALYRSLTSALGAAESGRLDAASRALVRAKRDVDELANLPRHARRRRKAEQAYRRVERALQAESAMELDARARLARSELTRLGAESA